MLLVRYWNESEGGMYMKITMEEAKKLVHNGEAEFIDGGK